MSLASSAETLTADRPASGAAYFSGVDSPRSASSMATNSSDGLDGHMEVSGDAAPSGACQAMPRPCFKCHLSVNVRAHHFRSLVKHFIPHVAIKYMMPAGLVLSCLHAKHKW